MSRPDTGFNLLNVSYTVEMSLTLLLRPGTALYRTVQQPVQSCTALYRAVQPCTALYSLVRYMLSTHAHTHTHVRVGVLLVYDVCLLEVVPAQYDIC